MTYEIINNISPEDYQRLIQSAFNWQLKTEL